MKLIGVLSDTHNYFDDKLKTFFKDVDELWHAGDIGSLALADEISAFKPLIAVSGNIDDANVRSVYSETAYFKCENLNILIYHITGYPKKYAKSIKGMVFECKPDILVGGHSHILKIIYDKKHSLLHINPGAAGISGFHNLRTAVRFKVDGSNMFDMEVGEWERHI